MTVEIMFGDAVVSGALFNISNMLIDSHRKRAYGASYILFLTRTCEHIYNIFSRTCGKAFHLIPSAGNRRRERIPLPFTYIVLAYVTFTARKVTCKVMEKRWFCWRVSNVRCNFIFYRGCSSIYNLSLFWKVRTQDPIVFQNIPMFLDNILNLPMLDREGCKN